MPHEFSHTDFYLMKMHNKCGISLSPMTDNKILLRHENTGVTSDHCTSWKRRKMSKAHIGCYPVIYAFQIYLLLLWSPLQYLSQYKLTDNIVLCWLTICLYLLAHVLAPTVPSFWTRTVIYICQWCLLFDQHLLNI